ncbi:hypothetical protein AAFC00_000681 [Neodothiora populina]|uniref:BTB domain-containing protein n=1 Tax=Neodothiora populina TaxID=2781224 RepID=A0ABR3PDQ0_9PEZI
MAASSSTNPLSLPVSFNLFSLNQSTHPAAALPTTDQLADSTAAVASSSSAAAAPSSSSAAVRFPTAAASNNNTHVMSGSPRKTLKKRTHEPYLPKIITTVGQRPACLVNASVTYVGKDEIYAFGGFDQFTDEVYNHVLRLNLNAKQWNLVDNYGDIPGVRMGHTACLWQSDKLLVFGGENEHRAHLSDVIIFDLTTAHWTQPEIHGLPPRGRARHSAVIHDDKLFISGGMTGHDNSVLDDISYLDLRTWTWSRPWRFVPRYDHSTWIWGGRLWVSGGMTEEMERTSEIWWLDLKGIPAFESASSDQSQPPVSFARSANLGQPPPMPQGGYTANSSSVQMTPGHMINRNVPMAPGSISSLKFISSPNLPVQNVGIHFHVFSSGCLLDFVTPASPLSALETSLSAFDLDTLRWQKLADGKHLFNPNYRWHYCCLDADGTNAWLLGCPNQARNGQNNESEEYLSDVLHLDLRKLGLLGNKMTTESRIENTAIPNSDSHIPSHLSAIGADLARTFDIPPELGSGADYIITAEHDDDDYEYGERVEYETANSAALGATDKSANRSRPIHVHRFILSARWPHFQRVLSHKTIEFHTNTMHIPEPYSAVRAFLYYLYTDSIAPASSSPHGIPSATPCPSLEDVAGMLVMSNIYDMPRLHHLCVARLSRELDIQHAALIFAQASIAQEHWLKRRAASFCMTHWGRVVRTDSFKRLSKEAMLELCEEIDAEGRVVGGDELEAVGALGGARLGGLGGLYGTDGRKRRLGSIATVGEEDEGLDDEGMEIA